MSDRVTGKIRQMYIKEDVSLLELDIPESEAAPDGFRLTPDVANYSAMYSLALAAAANRWPIEVRVKGGIMPTTGFANVLYLVVRW